ncbi:CAP domain-containing protein [Hansschlegelia beijingensis]|uniref:Uncharacterized protein YkwD n=1 Tax=Hansschlegelia beijingensis TaxID=1133344 RepID=A0A7W6GIF0_9HYPH|nr:CAP domain-containing protein [Hansschlegelia beijingensis]MBB3974779.1 uncharacterized protein YkwD [Hansschlegelia beijingensis]
MPHRSTRRAFIGAACIALALAGCSSTAPTPPATTPGLYQSQSKAGATLDRRAAAEMVSEFRRGRGLGPVTLDPALNRMAEEQANAMARDNKLSHETSAGSLKARIARSGYRNGGMWENIGAGHDTLADAFTGWRSSPPHMKNMLQPKASRIGIAAARAPGTRYEVFWAMVLADPNDPRPEVTAAQVNRAVPSFPIGVPGGIYVPSIH